MKNPVMIIGRVEDDVRQAMYRVKEDEGVALEYQINAALRAWLTKRGQLKKAAAKAVKK